MELFKIKNESAVVKENESLKEENERLRKTISKFGILDDIKNVGQIDPSTIKVQYAKVVDGINLKHRYKAMVTFEIDTLK
jgi:regulator of replication initiation timing